MAKTITSYPNIFGGTNRYDVAGHKIGYSRPGILSDEVYYDTHHNKVGTSRVGIAGYENHYDIGIPFSKYWDTHLTNV